MTANQLPTTPNRKSFSLATLLWLTTATAVWIGYLNARASNDLLEPEVRLLKIRSRELFVDNPLEYAAVQNWNSDGTSTWLVYLPHNRNGYRIQIADEVPRGVTRNSTVSREMLAYLSPKSFDVTPGRHTIEVRCIDSYWLDEANSLHSADDFSHKCTWEVVVDGTRSLTHEARNNNLTQGFVADLWQQPTAQPLLLIADPGHISAVSGRRSAKMFSSDGVLLWIDERSQ